MLSKNWFSKKIEKLKISVFSVFSEKAKEAQQKIKNTPILMKIQYWKNNLTLANEIWSWKIWSTLNVVNNEIIEANTNETEYE